MLKSYVNKSLHSLFLILPILLIGNLQAADQDDNLRSQAREFAQQLRLYGNLPGSRIVEKLLSDVEDLKNRIEELSKPTPAPAAEPAVHTEIPAEPVIHAKISAVASSSDSSASSSSSSSDARASSVSRNTSSTAINSITHAIVNNTAAERTDIMALVQMMRNAKSYTEVLADFQKIVSDPSTTNEVRALALAYIGALYQAGCVDATHRFYNATNYYANALTFIDLPEPVHAAIRIRLGHIYYDGGFDNYTTALHHFEFVLNKPLLRSYLPPMVIANALVVVGDIYTGIRTRNFANAVIHFTEALNIPELSASRSALAHARLGDIYFKGGYGVPRDLAKAQYHYTTALQSGNLPQKRISHLANRLSSMLLAQLSPSSHTSSSASSSSTVAPHSIEGTSASQPSTSLLFERDHVSNIRDLFRSQRYEEVFKACESISRNPSISEVLRKYASEFLKALWLEKDFPLPHDFQSESAYYKRMASKTHLSLRARASALALHAQQYTYPTNPERNLDEACRLLEEALAIPSCDIEKEKRESWIRFLEDTRRKQTSSSSSSHASASSYASLSVDVSAVALAKEEASAKADVSAEVSTKADSSSSSARILPQLPVLPAFPARRESVLPALPARIESAKRSEREPTFADVVSSKNLSDKRQKTALRYSCDLCGETYSRRQAYKVHTKTKKHQRNEKKQQQLVLPDTVTSDDLTSSSSDDDFIPSRRVATTTLAPIAGIEPEDDTSTDSESE